jgi:hypothetical protein
MIDSCKYLSKLMHFCASQFNVVDFNTAVVFSHSWQSVSSFVGVCLVHSLCIPRYLSLLCE